jgi:lipopolysaccharide biosynthesis glycosyltransferase
MMEASCCKLKIFQYPNIHRYQKILYVDTDVFVQSDINVLFDSNISSEKLHALEEGKIGDVDWGAQFFTFGGLNMLHTTKFYKQMKAFSAGVFYFMNNPSIKMLFEKTNAHIEKYMKSKRPIPICLDQPFLVYNSFTLHAYDNQYMKQYVVNNPTIVDTKKILYHFPGGPGNYESKFQKMTVFWEKMTKGG